MHVYYSKIVLLICCIAGIAAGAGGVFITWLSFVLHGAIILTVIGVALFLLATYLLSIAFPAIQYLNTPIIQLEEEELCYLRDFSEVIKIPYKNICEVEFESRGQTGRQIYLSLHTTDSKVHSIFFNNLGVTSEELFSELKSKLKNLHQPYTTVMRLIAA